jgi:hypothetical protein
MRSVVLMIWLGLSCLVHETNVALAQDQLHCAIQTAKLFCIGRFGLEGTVLEAQLELCDRVKTPRTAAELEQLLTDATPEGKLYILYGLYRLDRARYETAKRAFLAAPGPSVRTDVFGAMIEEGHVAIGEGCVLQTLTKADAVSSIESGRYDETFDLTCSDRHASN